MIRSCWHFGKQEVTRLGLGLAAVLVFAACNRNPPATPTPLPPTVTTATTPAAVATATSAAVVEQPTAPTTVITGEGTIFTSPNYTYTVVLPCCWLALPTPGTAIKSALAEAEEAMPLWGDLNERVQADSNDAVMELVALLPDEADGTMPIAQMTASVLPTNGLTLHNYLEATEAELKGIANTTVLSATIEDELGADGFPASLIKYTATSANATNDQTIAGLQVAFYGYAPETLIVLTFTTTIDRFAELESEFLTIVRSVNFNDPAL